MLMNREVWPLRFLFIFVVFGALLQPSIISRDIPQRLQNGGGWPLFTAYLIVFYVLILPLCSAEWSLGHTLKGTVGTFLTFPIFGAFVIGIIVLNLIVSPLQGAATGVSAYYLYHTFTPSLFSKIIDCGAQEKIYPAVEFGHCFDFVKYERALNPSRQHAFTHPGDYPNVTERFFAHAVGLHSPANTATDLTIKNPVNWDAWLACLAVFGLTFLAVSGGPATLGFFAFVYVLAVCALIVVFCVMIQKNENPWSVFSRGMKTPEWDILKERRIWEDTLKVMFQVSTLGMGIMPTLANFNHPRSTRWYISDLIFIGILFPAFLIGASIFHFTLSSMFPFGSIFATDQFTFVYSPLALSTVSPSRVWVALFYTSEILQGVLHLSCSLEVINSCIMHMIEMCLTLRRPIMYRPVVSFLTAIVMTFTSIVYVADGGYKLREFVAEKVVLFIPALVVIELMILFVYLMYEIIRKGRGMGRACARPVCKTLVLPFLVLFAAVCVYLTYILNLKTFEKEDIVGWVIALLPLAVSVAITPVFLIGACCYGCVDKEESPCSVLAGPHIARTIETTSWSYGEEEDFMLPKYM